MNEINSNYRNYGISRFENPPAASGVGSVSKTESNASVTEATNVRFQEAFGSVANELGLPEIESAGSATSEEMEQGLDAVAKKLTSVMSGVRGNKAMFDIYALMDLVQEVSQRLRNALSEVRQLENQSIQMNIRNQAEVQRRAAICGAIAGAVVCAVQIGATAVVSGATMKNMASQSELQAKSGADVFSQAEEMTKAATSPESAARQLETVKNNPQKFGGEELFNETRMGHFEQAQSERNMQIANAQGEKNSAQTRLNDAVQNGAAKEEAVNTAQSKVEIAEAKVAEAEARVVAVDKAAGSPEAQVAEDAYNNQVKIVDELTEIAGGTKSDGTKATMQERIAATEKLQIERSKLETLKTDRITARQDLQRAQLELHDAKQELTLAKSEFEAAGKEIETAQVDLQTKANAVMDLEGSKSSLAEALQKDVNHYAEQYQTARNNANMELDVNGEIKPETRQALDKAANQLKIATAKQAKEMSGFIAENKVKVEDVASMQSAAGARFNAAQAKGMTAADQLKGQSAITKLQMWQTISSSMGQYGQQLVNSLQQLIAANATELQAEQKAEEDELEQIKDLLSQQLSVIQKAFEIFASISSKESQSIESIIRA